MDFDADGLYELAAPVPYDLRENYEHGRFAPLILDAYVHAARSMPGHGAGGMFRRSVLSVRIVDSAAWAGMYGRQAEALSGVYLADGRVPRVCSSPGRPAVFMMPDPDATESFPSLEDGVAVIDGESLLGTGGEIDPYRFRYVLLESYARMLIAAGAVDGIEDAYVGVSGLDGGLLSAIGVSGDPVGTMSAVFASYYASDAETRAVLREQWLDVPGLAPMLALA